jgi:hypothetical protein
VNIGRWRIGALHPPGSRSDPPPAGQGPPGSVPPFSGAGLSICREDPRQCHRLRTSKLNRGPSNSCVAFNDSTDGLPQQWRMLEELNPATTDAVMYAVARGWALVEEGTSICLTDAGKRLVVAR